MLGDLLATPTRNHLLSRAAKNRVVSFMGRHLHLLDFASSQNIETSISSLLQILSTVKCAHIGIIIRLLKCLASWVLFVLLMDEVKRCSCLVFFSCVELVNLGLKYLLIPCVICAHLFESVSFTLIPLVSQRSKLVLLLIKFLGACSLVSYCEVFVESLAF